MASSPDVTPSAENTPGSPGSGTTERRGRVRGRRAAVLAVPATLAAATLAVLTAEGILGVQFAISGMPFVVKADKLEGVGFEQYGSLDHMIKDSPNQGDTDGSVLVVTSVIGRGKLTNMCQAVDLGGIQLVLTAGNKGTKAEVENLAIDSDEIMGNAKFDDIEIGRDSSTFDRVPGFKGPAGVYGQQARTVTIDNLYQHNYGATAAVFKLPDLSMKFSTSGCPES